MPLVLDGVTLNPNMRWVDELNFTPVGQDRAHAVDGTLLIQEGVVSAGRPFTIVAGEDFGWNPRSVVLALIAKLTPNRVMTLTYPSGSSYTVTWDHSNGDPIVAKPAGDRYPWVPSSTDDYVATLKLIGL